MFIESNASLKAENLARDILILSRNTLLVNLRFLDAAISQLKLKKLGEIPTLATDGQFLYFNTWHVLNSYKLEKENPTRDYLHVIFHCLFHHPFVNKRVHHGCWDLACDIAAENALNELELPAVKNSRQAKQGNTIYELKCAFPLMTAEKIYRHYLDQNLSDEQLAGIRLDFYADDHSIWYQREKRKAARQKGGDKDAGEGEESQSSKGDNQDQGDTQDLSDAIAALGEMIKTWKNISERAQVDIETASRKWGKQKGGLHQGLNQVNREKYDYASFLQRFSVLGEVMQLNDDEFDMVFYTYGLSLYKNLPLIEPLETKEVKRVKEFVIALDTSGSVQGRTVQTFVQKTYNILKQTENFFTRINVHIIQCDAAVQEDHKITTPEEFEQYIRTMTLRGFGGTDFRPVFTYVDQLIEDHEFENLKGLIYFTDGQGVYPTKKPEYDTAFVFLDEDYVEVPDVPYWAIKLVLSTDDIVDGGNN